MSSAPPPCFWELFSTVDSYLTRCSRIRGWALDGLEDGPADTVNAYPFASGDKVGVHVTYEHSKTHVKGRVMLSSAMKSVKEALPIITCQSKVNKASNTVEFDIPKGKLDYTLAHPAFFVTLSSMVLSGCCTIATASTRLAENTFAGAMITYDPMGSGLKNLNLVAVQQNCPNFCGGDLVAKYSLESGLSAHLRVPVHTYTDVAIIGERNRFIAGFQGRSPCGSIMQANVNLTDSTYTLTAIRNMKDMWKVCMTFTAPLMSSGQGSGKSTPRFGVKFVNMDAPIPDGEN